MVIIIRRASTCSCVQYQHILDCDWSKISAKTGRTGEIQVPRENRITRGMQGSPRASRVLRVSRSMGISPALLFLESRGQLLESWLAPIICFEVSKDIRFHGN